MYATFTSTRLQPRKANYTIAEVKGFSRRHYPETRLFFYNFFVFQVQVDGLIRNLLIYTQYTLMLYTPQDLWPIHDHALKLLRISRGDQRSMDL